MLRVVLGGPGPATLAHRHLLSSAPAALAARLSSSSGSLADDQRRKQRPRPARQGRGAAHPAATGKPEQIPRADASHDREKAALGGRPTNVARKRSARSSKVASGASKDISNAQVPDALETEATLPSPTGHPRARRTSRKLQNTLRPNDHAKAWSGSAETTRKGKGAISDPEEALGEAAAGGMVWKSPDTVAERHTSTAASASSPVHDDSVIFAAPPAAAVDLGQTAQRIVTLLSNHDTAGATVVWKDLILTNMTDTISNDDCSAIGRALDGALNHSGVRLSELYFTDPEQFGILRHMIIEVGARGWLRPICTLQVSLLRGGLPAVASLLFDAIKKRMRQVQNKDAAGLKSKDRATRLAARLDRHEGFENVILHQIAALTMLGEFNAVTIMNFFDTKARMMILPKTYTGYLRQILGPQYHQFEKNLQKVSLCLLCFHPFALLMRLETMAAASDKGESLQRLYHRLMEASIGHDRVIVPMNSWSQLHYDNVPLPFAVWSHLIGSFGAVGMVDEVMHAINVDIPARHHEVPAYLLATAMRVVAWSSVPNHTRVTHSPAAMARAKTLADGLWRRIVAAGAQDEPEVVRNRLFTLFEWGDKEEMRQLYNSARTRARLQQQYIGHQIIPPMFQMLCKYPSRFNEAMTLLDDLAPPTETKGLSAFKSVVDSISAARFSYKQRRQLLTKLLNRRESALLGPSVWGRIQSFLLEGGMDVEKASALVEAQRGRRASSVFYRSAVNNLLWQRAKSSSVDILAAVHLLERYALLDVEVARLIDLYALWRGVVYVIVQSSNLSATERHELLLRVFAKFPMNGGSYAVRLLHYAAYYSFLRRDGTGIPEGLFWWRRLEATGLRIESRQYVTVIIALVNQGQTQVAQEIVEVIPDPGRHVSVYEAARNLGLQIQVPADEGEEDDAPEEVDEAIEMEEDEEEGAEVGQGAFLH